MLLLLVNFMQAQPVSPFNRLELKDTSANYSFIVSGHFHGASTNISSFPASSLLANIDTLNALHSSFLLSLGDMFQDVDEQYMVHYQKSLFDKLKMPVFNSVGNHDLSNGNLYEKVYGKTFFTFRKGTELFIVLNTEIDNGSIKGEQLNMLKNALAAAGSGNVKNVFVFSHRPVWAESNEKYSSLFKENTHSAMAGNFDTDIKPLLKTLGQKSHVYWCSGSMGGAAPASFFYDTDAETNVTYIQTAIRELPRDAVLLVSVKNGTVSFKGISFTGQQLNAVESYNTAYWKTTDSPEQGFNYRLLPYLAMQMLSHHFFWTGFAAAILVIIVVAFVRKRWKRKK